MKFPSQQQFDKAKEMAEKLGIDLSNRNVTIGPNGVTFAIPTKESGESAFDQWKNEAGK